MIDHIIVELMNKDIDKTISLKEKKKLNQYLKEYPEANVLFKELLKSEEMLDKIDDINPSSDLKERILNSIDYNLYSNQKKEVPFWGYLSSIFSGSRTSYAVSFGVAMIAGLIILTAVFYNSTIHDELDKYSTSGTMGLHKFNIVQSFDILSENVSGKVDVSKVNNYYYGFNVTLNSPVKYRLLIEFNPDNLSFDNLPIPDLNSVSLENGPGYVQITSSQDLNYFLSFSAKDLSSEKFKLKIFTDNKELFNREIFISKN